MDHKTIDDAMEFGVKIMQLGIVGCLSILTGAQGSEVLSSFGSEVIEQLKNDPAGCCCADLHVEVDLIVSLGTHFIIDYNRAELEGKCF